MTDDQLMLVNIPVKCGCCGETTTVQVNAWDAKQFKILKAPSASWGDCKEVVERYKKIKGYDRFPTWDGQYLKMAVKEVKRLMHFFRKLEDPKGVTLELLEDTAEQAKKDGWAWTLFTLRKRAPDWLLAKAKAAEMATRRGA